MCEPPQHYITLKNEPYIFKVFLNKPLLFKFDRYLHLQKL